jgi:hypothetical protein
LEKKHKIIGKTTANKQVGKSIKKQRQLKNQREKLQLSATSKLTKSIKKQKQLKRRGREEKRRKAEERAAGRKAKRKKGRKKGPGLIII